MVTLEELEKRMQVLEDLEALKKLKARYAQVCDDLYNPDEMVKLFTEDAVWDGGEVWGVHKGKQAIYDFFKGASSNLLFAIHYFSNPNITIQGNKAWGRWYLWQACTRYDNTPLWLAGYEDDEYMKIDGQWLQSRMRLTLLFLTPYDQGWVKKRIVD